MEKAAKFLEEGLKFLEGEKPKAKKAINYLAKAWKFYTKSKAWDKVYETLDKIADIYHKYLKEPRSALEYLDEKHDLMIKFGDFEGAINTLIQTADMFNQYEKGKDEALDFLRKAYAEIKKFKVGDNLIEVINENL
ncbi:MAG: hypothetical protein ACTSRP_14790 [Candidatus Helarchaeota archaeon]